MFDLCLTCRSLQPYFVLFIRNALRGSVARDYFVVFVTLGVFQLNTIPHFGGSSDREQEC